MTSHRATLLLLASTACWRESHSTECTEPVYAELADDEPSPMGITANSLLAISTPGWEGTAESNGHEVDVAFTVERGEGPALFADTEQIEVVHRSFHLGGGEGSDLMGDPTCEDWVEIPADFAIVSEEAGIDLAMDATIRSPSDSSRGRNPGADIDGSVPYEQSGLVVDGIDKTFDEQTIEVSVSMQPAEQSGGSIYWHGSEQDDERIVRILTWD